MLLRKKKQEQMRKLENVNIKSVISVIRNFTDTSLLFQVGYHSHFDVKSEDTWHVTKFCSNDGTLMCLTNRGYTITKC